MPPVLCLDGKLYVWCAPCIPLCHYWAVMSVLEASELPGVSVTSRLIELKASVKRSGGNGQGAALSLWRNFSLQIGLLSLPSLSLRVLAGWPGSQSVFQFKPKLLNGVEVRVLSSSSTPELRKPILCEAVICFWGLCHCQERNCCWKVRITLLCKILL